MAWENYMNDKGELKINDKVDVIDFIINILRDHERKLDYLIGRLEMLCHEQEERMRKQNHVLLRSLESE